MSYCRSLGVFSAEACSALLVGGYARGLRLVSARSSDSGRPCSAVSSRSAGPICSSIFPVLLWRSLAERYSSASPGARARRDGGVELKAARRPKARGPWSRADSVWLLAEMRPFARPLSPNRSAWRGFSGRRHGAVRRRTCRNSPASRCTIAASQLV
jgi:hypothetical protein